MKKGTSLLLEDFLQVSPPREYIRDWCKSSRGGETVENGNGCIRRTVKMTTSNDKDHDIQMIRKKIFNREINWNSIPKIENQGIE